jgi:hypothetical protein
MRQQYSNVRGLTSSMADLEDMGVSFSRITISAAVYVKFGIAPR